uniref:Putative secreted protein n=1 Tax=Amblyomma triste TaxID=251400 RepID=A0A023G0J8_AMBTT
MFNICLWSILLAVMGSLHVNSKTFSWQDKQNISAYLRYDMLFGYHSKSTIPPPESVKIYDGCVQSNRTNFYNGKGCLKQYFSTRKGGGKLCMVGVCWNGQCIDTKLHICSNA